MNPALLASSAYGGFKKLPLGVRLIIGLIVGALVVLVLFAILKPILKFLGLDESVNKNERETREIVLDGLNQYPSLPPGSPIDNGSYEEDFGYLQSYVEELRYVINKTYISGFGSGERCEAWKHAIELEDHELARVANSYRKAYGKSLRLSIQDLTFNGCDDNWFEENQERYDTQLVNRLKAIESGL